MNFPKSMRTKGGVRVTNTAALKFSHTPTAASAARAEQRLKKFARQVRVKTAAVAG